MSARQSLLKAITLAGELETDVVDKLLSSPKDTGHGDFALPCFPFAKEWKLSPPECAKTLAEKIELPKEIERFEIAGPYINFFLNRGAHASALVTEVLNAGRSFGTGDKQ